MADAVQRLGFSRDPQSEEYVMLGDTWASLKRIGLGVGLAAIAGLLTGLNMGLLPRVKALFSPFITFLSMVPPLAVLPILFIALGVDEVSKVTLIFLGVFPVIARDIHIAAERVPREQIVKAFPWAPRSSACSTASSCRRCIPRSHRASGSPSEAHGCSSSPRSYRLEEGLGYRIFLMRRYLAMDVILPYVLWITALRFHG